jgi:hypothetical protein
MGDRKPRSPVTDVAGVQLQGSGNVLYTVDTDAEVADLICEGEIEGLVSGSWDFKGKNLNAGLDKGQTGFASATFNYYSATGIQMAAGSNAYNRELGFLRSIYWNDTPIVDQNGYYNFSNINVEYTKGIPEGSLTVSDLNSKLPPAETMDLSVERSIGERLYGVSTQGGTAYSATSTRDLANDEAIDVVAKTYTIVNKHCNKAQIRVKVSQLFEQIATAASKQMNNYKRGYSKHPDNVGYGDIKARTVEYNIYFQPVFDAFPDVVDGDVSQPRTWTLAAQESIKGHINQSYIRSTPISFDQDYMGRPGFSGWRIKIIRLTPESLTSYLKSITHVDSLVEIYGTKLRYPYSAMVYSRFNAEFFSQIPQRSYDTKLLKVKIPNNYDPIKKTYGHSEAIEILPAGWPNCKINSKLKAGQKVYFQSGGIMLVGQNTNPSASTTIPGGSSWVRGGSNGALYDNHQYPVALEQGATTEGFSGGTDDDHFWDGGFKQIDTWPVGASVPYQDPVLVEKEWTDNPAWCFYDLVTNPRYGLGEFIEDIQIDKWSLYEISQYCDVLVPDGYGSLEPRFTMNHIIVSRDEAYKVLNDLVSVFRGMLYYSNGLIHAVQDAYKLPLYQFNNSNVVDGDFNYSSSAKKARHTVAIVRYIDKYSLYTPGVEYVEDQEGIKRYGLRQIETTALGCTSRGQARRFGDWILTSEAQETESISFSVGQDGAYIKPGDIVQVYDQFRTPQHFAGRTNVVSPLGPAPANINYGSTTPPPNQNGSVTGNSIIIDNAVHFDANSVYKFSLLTPSYNYEDVSDMNSSGVNEIRRSNLQTLYFLGHHTETVSGYYNSNYEEGGSGIATKIYFHTGLLLGDATTPIGTGNQLDFDNYVITGYTNNYVQGPEAHIIESYSGGCFSGANLVWSIENNNPTSPEFISGHFTDYRVINISEDSEKGTYSIQGLDYSTGKYEEVENRLSFDNPQIQDSPQWPYLKNADNTKSVANNVSIIASHPTLQNYVGPNINSWRDDEKNSKQYSTVEIRIPQAALKLVQGDAQNNKIPFNIDQDESSTSIASMRYTVAIYTIDDINLPGFGDSTLGVAQFQNETTILHPLSTDPSAANYYGKYAAKEVTTLNGDPSNYVDQGTDSEGNTIPGGSALHPVNNATNTYNSSSPRIFFLERPLLEDTNYWVAVIAFNNNTRSANAIVGLIPSSTFSTESSAIHSHKLPENLRTSEIRGVEIHSMTSEDFAGSGDEQQNSLNELTSNQPTFSWTVGADLRFHDDYDRILQYPNSFDYRITIRRFNENAINDNSISSDIFVELTGLRLSTQEPGFTFLNDYNNPNTIENLQHNPDVIRYDNAGNSGNLANGLVSAENTRWYREDTSGVIFQNNSNSFPLRKFDIVVEAHNGDGQTSANNKVWQNTIGSNESESFARGDGLGFAGEGEGYDNYPGLLPVPSGVVFAQGWTNEKIDNADTNTSLDDYHFLTPTGGYVRNYPYTASAAAYTDGTLKISIEPSIDSAGNRILSESALSDIFNDIQGIVYYYSTGNNTMIDAIDNGQVMFEPLNKSPYFNLDKTAIAGSQAFGYLGSVAYNKSAGGTAYWEPPVAKPAGWRSKKPDQTNMKTMRWYHDFGGTIPDLSDITIGKFPSLGSSLVDNIYLTIGFYDSLSTLQHFDEDGVPKTVIIDNSSSSPSQIHYEDPTQAGFPAETGPQEVPTILLDPSINFSTIPTDLWEGMEADAKREILKFDPQRMLQEEGTPVFLKERSLITDGQSALAYRAWFDVTLDPGEAWMITNGNSRLSMDFGVKTGGREALYRGPYRQKPHDLSSVVYYPNKNKLKGFSKIQFEVTESYQPEGAALGFLKAGYLTLYFEQEYDPTSYTVDVEFKQANLVTTSIETQKDGSITNNVKITDSFIHNAEGEPNVNPNARDLVTTDLPLDTCALVEKSRKYVKFHLSPFWIPGSYNYLGEEMLSGEYEFVVEYQVHPGTGVTGLTEYFPNPESDNERYDQGYWTKTGWKSTSRDEKFGFIRMVAPIENYYTFTIDTSEKFIGAQTNRGVYNGHSWTSSATGNGTNYAFSYIRKKGTDASADRSNVLAYGYIRGWRVNWGSQTYKRKDGVLTLNTNARPSIKLPPAAVISTPSTILEAKVGEYLETKLTQDRASLSKNPYAFLGNILQIKGGILLTDKFDNG